MTEFSNGRKAALGGAGLAVVGVFLPWATVLGISVSGIDTPDGQVTLGILVVVGLVAVFGNWGRWSRLAVAIGALWCIGVALLYVSDPALGTAFGQVVSPGIGLYVTGIGGGVVLAGTLVDTFGGDQPQGGGEPGPDQPDRTHRSPGRTPEPAGPGSAGRGSHGPDLLARIEGLTDDQLRTLVADLWAEQGLETSVEPGDSDRAIDVRARQDDERTVTRTRAATPDSPVDAGEVETAASIREQEPGVDRVLLVTSGTYTDGAYRRATEQDVELIDGVELADAVEGAGAAYLLEEYPDPRPGGREAQATREGDGGLVDYLRNSPRIPREVYGERPPRNVWFYVVVLGTLGWIGAFVGTQVVADDTAASSAVGLLIIVVWVGLPVGIYRDAYTVTQYTDWSPTRVLYTVLSVVPLLNALVGAYYLYRRYRAGQRALADAAPGYDGVGDQGTDPWR